MNFKVLDVTVAVILILHHTSGLRKRFVLDDLKQLDGKHVGLDDQEIWDTDSISADENNDDDSLVILPEDNEKEWNSDQNQEDHDFLSEKKVVHVVHRCCSRRPKIIQLGFDMAGNEQFLDIGECSKSCSNHQKHPHHRHHRHRHIVAAVDDTNSSLSSHEDTEQTADNVPHHIKHCQSHHQCEATTTIVKTHHLLDGPVQVDVVQECNCVFLPPSCSKTPNIRTYYPNTPYERAVDIGKCEGRCGGNGLTCNSARNKTVFIEGPNGGICVSIIEECSCSASCYRMKFYESFFRNVWNDETNSTEEEILDIDVGKCVGKCDNEMNFHCVLRDSSDPEKCLMSLKKQAAECIPAEFKIQTFEDSSGEEKSVAVIENCGCK